MTTVRHSIDPNATDPLGRRVWEVAGYSPSGEPIYRPIDYDDCGSCENGECEECGVCLCC